MKQPVAAFSACSTAASQAVLLQAQSSGVSRWACTALVGCSSTCLGHRPGRFQSDINGWPRRQLRRQRWSPQFDREHFSPNNHPCCSSTVCAITTTTTTSAFDSFRRNKCILLVPQTAVSLPRQPILALLSSIVGVLVLIGSLLYKIPQVLRIARRRSGKGVSITMYALETIGTTFSVMYFARRAFAFSAYGELVFVMIQNVIILSLLVFVEKLNRPMALAVAVAYAVLVGTLLWPAVPLKALMALQVAAIPILNFARVPQIILNWRRKSTGELAPITLGLQLLGNVARIFTTLASVRDSLMLIGVCVSSVFNTALVLQWLYYKSNEAQIVAESIAAAPISDA